MTKGEMLQAYSELAYVCGIVDAMASDTKDSDSKTLAMWRDCAQRLIHVGNLLHNQLLDTNGPGEPSDDLTRYRECWGALYDWISTYEDDDGDVGDMVAGMAPLRAMRYGMRRCLLKMLALEQTNDLTSYRGGSDDKGGLE